MAAVVYGTNVNIPNDIMVASFKGYLSSHGSCVLSEALNEGEENFTIELASQLVGILSQFGCCKVPRPSNLQQLIVELAKHEFITKPLGALQALRNGIPSVVYAKDACGTIVPKKRS